MTIEQIIGFSLIAQLCFATIFYSLGFKDGKSVGYVKGRTLGIKIGNMEKAVK